MIGHVPKGWVFCAAVGACTDCASVDAPMIR